MGLVAIASLLAGCGSTATPGSDPSPSTVSPSPPVGSEAGQVDLRILVDDGSARQTWTLTCTPPGGTHPDPANACRVLAAAGERALPPVAKDRACTQIYGGPQTATITGTWNGKPVTSTLSRVNGCEISRWDALAGLLPKAGT